MSSGAQKEARFFEFLICIQMVLRLFRDVNPEATNEIGWLQFLDEYYFLEIGTFIFFLMMHIRHEGTRISFIFFTLGQILLTISKYTEYQYPILTFITTISVTFACFIFYTFPVLRFPMYQGSFNVGVKKIKVKGTDVALYYPIQDKKKAYTQWMTEDQLKQMFKVLQCSPKPITIHKFIQYWMFKIVMYICTYRQFQGSLNAKIIQSHDKFPFIIFSHGLAAHNTYFSCLLGDLASKGCIVASIAHDDYQHTDKERNLQEFVQDMKPKFDRRLEQFEEVLAHFKLRENLDEIWTSTTVRLDYDKVLAMGHSLGGATALYSSIKNIDDIYGLILLDPALEPMNQEEGLKIIQETKLKKPILMLSSEYFQHTFKSMNHFENSKKFQEINQEYKHAILNCYIKNTGHENFGDLALTMGSELSKKKMVGNKNEIVITTVLISKLLEIFLLEISFSGKKFEDINMSNVTNKFNEVCKQVKQDNNLVVME